MSEQLAYELVPHQIDVSIIEPGGYPTNVWTNRNTYSTALKSALDGSAFGRLPATGHADGARGWIGPHQ
jgi:NAD(P)-dependent dehydrogenase (short-subunit alcohol dehydrogenase family)